MGVWILQNTVRVNGAEPRGGSAGLTKEAAEAVATGERQGDIAYFVLEGGGGEDFGGNFADFVDEPGEAKKKRDEGDEPGGLG